MEMDKTAREAVLQSEEDLQRMIELGAWYDGNEESNVATVEVDSETEPIYNRNEVSTLILSPIITRLRYIQYYSLLRVRLCTPF